MLPVAKKTSSAGFKPGPLPPRRRLVAVVAFDGVVLGDLATPCEVFGRVRDTKGNPLYELRVCSLRPVIESEHLMLTVPWRLASLKRAHMVVIPGIDNLDRPVPRQLLRALRGAVDRGTRVASICSGAFLLARTGALDGLKATTHWLASDELARRCPAVDVNPDVLYIDNGDILTSAGAAAGLDLCLHLVRRDFGAGIAAHAARVSVMPLERAGGQAQFIVHQQPVAVGDSSMGSLLRWIERNFRKELSLPVIARQAAMSTRTLSRRFLEQVGATPAQWIAHARVHYAQRLLETAGLSVEEVATEAGFGSAAVLRERFRQIVGTSPTAYRRAFTAGNHRH